MRIPVLSAEGKPLMPSKPSRVRRWLKNGLAKVVKNDLNVFCVQLTRRAGCATQPIVVGIDPGKLFTGIAIQSAKFTLLTAHLVLPFKTVKERMEQRRMMRRGRRGRRINRKIEHKKRAHRQKRFDNRKARKVPPSIKSNRQLELRVVKEMQSLYPVVSVVYEVVKARGNKGFSPVMVGQKWMVSQLEQQIGLVFTKEGWETSNMRERLGLAKQKHSKGDSIPATHAIDGVALASSQFTEYRKWYGNKTRGSHWFGEVQLTRAPFLVIRRPPICRRQLHLMIPSKGGIRRKYGGTVTRHGVRKGDYVKAEKAGHTYYGWVSGDAEKQVSVSDINWKRLGQFTAKKVNLIQRSNGLLVEAQGYFQAG